MKKNFSAKVCARCLKSFLPTAPPQKYCGSFYRQEGCSYLIDLKRHRERMKIVNRKKQLIGRRCGFCRHLLMLHKPGQVCDFGAGKKCTCVRMKKHYNDGTRKQKAKLTVQQVLQIRALANQKTRAALGREFHIVPSAISQIINGKAWKQTQ